MFSGSRVLAGMSREHLFGSVIFAAGVVLCVFALVPSLLFSVLCALVIGFLGGTAWIIGQTMLGRDVADELRGRTFAFVQSLIRVTLVLILAVSPALAGMFGAHTLSIPGALYHLWRRGRHPFRGGTPGGGRGVGGIQDDG